MTRDETVALLLECEAKRGEARAAALAAGESEYGADDAAHEAAKAHWNAWAEPLLAERKAMEADGRWAAAKHFLGSIRPKNAATRAWMNAASVSFSRCLFVRVEEEGTEKTKALTEKQEKSSNTDSDAQRIIIMPSSSVVDFSGFIFPGDIHLSNTIFSDKVRFKEAAFWGEARFRSAKFTSDTEFVEAEFFAEVRFDDAAFYKKADFRRATFAGRAMFSYGSFASSALFDEVTFSNAAVFKDATFSADARFDGVKFFDLTTFEGVTFSGDAQFEMASFSRLVWFKNAAFSKKLLLRSAIFEQAVDFAATRFAAIADLSDVKADRAFNMTGAKFKRVPIFNQADFKQTPDLDAVDFPLPGFCRRGEAGLIPQYRAIRRMAIQGADYEREQMAFKGETRSKRGTEHKPWHTAFWFGIAYDALSDYGRSIARPLAIWLASAIAFAAIYAWNAGVAVSGWGAACADDAATKALKALTLSAANSLPLIGSSRSEVAKEFYTACLALRHAPAWSPILQIWQTLWSAVLLFLFLLALRNQFKIK